MAGVRLRLVFAPDLVRLITGTRTGRIIARTGGIPGSPAALGYVHSSGWSRGARPGRMPLRTAAFRSRTSKHSATHPDRWRSPIRRDHHLPMPDRIGRPDHLRPTPGPIGGASTRNGKVRQPATPAGSTREVAARPSRASAAATPRRIAPQPAAGPCAQGAVIRGGSRSARTSAIPDRTSNGEPTTATVAAATGAHRTANRTMAAHSLSGTASFCSDDDPSVAECASAGPD